MRLGGWHWNTMMRVAVHQLWDLGSLGGWEPVMSVEDGVLLNILSNLGQLFQLQTPEIERHLFASSSYSTARGLTMFKHR